MVSAFLTPGGILNIADQARDEDILAKYPGWERRKSRDGKLSLVREAVLYLEYSKDNYWTGARMFDHVVQASMIFEFAFPAYQGVFAFDNASNHRFFADDALIVEKMNLLPGGNQPKMRHTFFWTGIGSASNNRCCLKQIQDSMMPDTEQMRNEIFTKYRTMISHNFATRPKCRPRQVYMMTYNFSR